MSEGHVGPTDDAANITALFNRHAQAVFRLCYSYLGSKADAEDALQAVFMKLVDQPRAFEDEGHERAWLLTCASNHCKDQLKSPKRTLRADMPEELPDKAAPSERSDTLEAVMALPEMYRECIYLHYYEGYKTGEIAEMLGIPPSTLRNRMSEARRLLRESLGGDGDGR